MPDRHPDDTDKDLPPQLPLSACPFCGTVPYLVNALRHGYYVSCENEHCPVQPETTFDTETPEQAAERWNTRPALPAAA
jgi:hypothetical protein